jgi:hypothetical protein
MVGEFELRVNLGAVESPFDDQAGGLGVDRKDVGGESQPKLCGHRRPIAHGVDREPEQDHLRLPLFDQLLEGLLVDVVLELLLLDLDREDLVDAFDIDRAGESGGILRDHRDGHRTFELLGSRDELERDRPQLAAQVLGDDEDAHAFTLCAPRRSP